MYENNDETVSDDQKSEGNEQGNDEQICEDGDIIRNMILEVIITYINCITVLFFIL